MTLDLGMLTSYLCEDKELAKILPVHVAGFFKSEPAMTIPGKDGARKPRQPATIAQIRRITRQFLCWAEEQKYLAKAPVPKNEAKHEKGKAEAKPKDAKKAAPDAASTPKDDVGTES